VIQRTKEIGVRIALGSSSAGVMWLVTRKTLSMVGLGAVIGTVAAVFLSPQIASQLFGVTPRDPVTVALVLAILIGVAGLAAYFPARRAATVDPVIALSSE